MLSTTLQHTQFYGKYAKFLHDEHRREQNIGEAATRQVDYIRWLMGTKLKHEEYLLIHSSLTHGWAYSAMRAFAMAGPAAMRDASCTYNCVYVVPKDITTFAEVMYLALAGCGVGFSVERKYVNKLPVVTPQHTETAPFYHRVADTSEGWADALKKCLEIWYDGFDLIVDYSAVRPEGSILRTKGGRASGPEPLRRALDAIRSILFGAGGRKLRPIEVFDILTHIGQAVVSGGGRRSAMSAIFDPDEEEMLTAKHPDNFNYSPEKNLHRANANISVVWSNIPSQEDVLKFWNRLVENNTGEPGFYNRSRVFRRRGPYAWKTAGTLEVGPNPCFEIDLLPYEFCNLTTIVARPDDTEEELLFKTRIAAMLGTIQACATHFSYIRQDYKTNCEAERLLGVSIAGMLDCPTIYRDNFAFLDKMRKQVIATNAEYSKRFGINTAACATAIKPDGNFSVYAHTSAGLHPWESPYYIRRLQMSEHDPIAQLLIASGAPWEPAAGRPGVNVIEFPVAAPETAITLDDVDAIQHLAIWKAVTSRYTEHNGSCTVRYKPEETDAISLWLSQNRSSLAALSFSPKVNGHYKQMPMERINKTQYQERSMSFPKVDWNDLRHYEAVYDTTHGSQEPGCANGACDIVSFA